MRNGSSAYRRRSLSNAGAPVAGLNGLLPRGSRFGLRCLSHRSHGHRPYVDPDVALATVGSSGFAGHESDTATAVPTGVEVILTVPPPRRCGRECFMCPARSHDGRRLPCLLIWGPEG